MLPVESTVLSSMQTTSLVVSPLVSGVIGIAVLLTGVSLLVPLARRLSLPFTVLIAILGLGVGFLAVFADNKSTGLFLNAIREMNVSSEAFLNIFLPPLLFAGGLTVDVRRMMDDFSPILVLAIIAVFLCTAAVGLSLWMATGTSLLVCMILGSLVATTDTAAVLGIFRDIGAPGRLTTIVEGESLFNDAAAIALFVVLLNILKTAAEVSVGAIFVTLIYGLIGGVLWGYVVARIYCWVIGEFRMGIVAEITLSVSLAYLTFVSSQLMGISGIIAVVVAAMTFASVGRTKLSPGAWETLSVTWRQLDFWSTSLLFVLAAMKAPTILNMAASESSGQIALGVATVFGAALLARAAVLWGILPMLTLAGLSQAISNNYKIVLCWGSLRGAITVALALAVSEDAGVAKEFKEFVFIIAMGYVLATLFISAPTLRPLMKMLSLDKLTPQERLVRDRVMALSRTRVSEALRDVSGRLGFRTTLQHRPAISSESEQGQQKMSHADLAQAGLVVAANREAEMSLEYLQQGKVSRRI
ncbi:MAG TPA: hypothetical protein DCL54_10810, partial [Alphaproteobacteria bacterium]|nr:hypothetical protein [Alphaproteobacteria bacterium]